MTLARRLHGHLSLARVSNTPTVVTNALAGAALAGVTRPDLTVLLVAAAMVLFYTGGMYLNDVMDEAIDRRERPSRPLPSGVVGRAEAIVVTALLFAVGLALLVPLGGPALLSGLVLVGVIVVYDAWHKTNPLSPVVMAVTRALVYVTALTAFSGAVTADFVAWTLLMGGYIVGLTYVAKTENRPGVARFWPAALVFLPGLYFVTRAPDVLGFALLALFLGWAAYALTFVYGARRSVGRAVVSLIAGVSLLDAMILAQRGAWPLVGIALAAFALTLALQRWVKGT
ncbi:UbiA family prenyltransferase [Deinococcus pimensis]|uniref:UbiA family prenyltransferase n=1 Tax=Deinococcus pimensis TaxID=309888 RepID=UPI00048169F5|nr:UbiA family prenyltransferase [Deinococcus pimensis]